mmetsp:Transcript_26593/g.57157  ORF Transcript_26593/g.57157 Transcript_26593/m.57157 type:complete len:120 (+) Transcript_26593:2247-2606(+)
MFATRVADKVGIFCGGGNHAITQLVDEDVTFAAFLEVVVIARAVGFCADVAFSFESIFHSDIGGVLRACCLSICGYAFQNDVTSVMALFVDDDDRTVPVRFGREFMRFEVEVGGGLELA